MNLDHEIMIANLLINYHLSRQLSVILFCFFSASDSNPDEDRLLQHLFYPDNQARSYMTTPIRNISDFVNVTIRLTPIKIIYLVKQKYLLHFVYRYVSDTNHSTICKRWNSFVLLTNIGFYTIRK